MVDRTERVGRFRAATDERDKLLSDRDVRLACLFSRRAAVELKPLPRLAHAGPFTLIPQVKTASAWIRLAEQLKDKGSKPR